MKRDDVCVLIPTLNEAGSIREVIEGFRSMGFQDILVIDGHSTDGTPDLAREAGARVIVQSGSGKGQALLEAFGLIDKEYIVLIDGDGTYLPSEVDRLLDPLMRGRADHVIGNRFSNLRGGSLKRLNLVGNWLINMLFGIIYGVRLRDILSGYRAFTRSGISSLDLSVTGFEIESEITIESLKKGLRIVEVPITYLPRAGGTRTKLSPLRDGPKIMLTIYRLAKTQNPLFYFGLMGAIFGSMGFLLGLYVVRDWLQGRIEHIPLTILTAILIIVGFQLFLMGIQGDMMATMHREVMRELYRKKR
ncbi:MAG: S-layer glycoprotein N-glycosyltransferase AglJ [Methanothrix sp.]|uniref:Glycosyl transferase, family 2 n=1 Tax=Methanothrix thermoacetophila (strain DSM 6194 / JCM 14653 / NBRC 101360 / PT) TaxID=349307 RepID=A0B8L4_METTP|nr:MULTISPECIES: S-layer glycoprotein N-glycosyltransferase AglJ [Methanothrix]ABK15038.1 glycosyl transferase, family 2 [Methanothrix thermoacetophila PT]MBC7079379.1 S-layer glycoprotein N-glycosyltransferase AglJ [Methanothrix sp.]NPU86846.1 S-layer glycoprotein N-glycosyltransferase AglJ [Methanothrix sp.]